MLRCRGLSWTPIVLVRKHEFAKCFIRLLSYEGGVKIGRRNTIKAVIDAGVSIKVLDRSYIDLETSMGRGFMAMMSAMAEDERLRIIKRTHEGRKIAQAKGVRMGRKPKLTPHQKTEARRRIAKGESTRDLAKSYGVSVSTISWLTP